MLKLETERCILLPWEDSLDDAKGLYAYAKSPNVGPRAGWAPHKDLQSSLEIIRTLFLNRDVFKIVYRQEDKIIGSISLDWDTRRDSAISSRELGYSLDENYWNRGIMTEVARKVIDYGFKDLGLKVIAIQTGPSNFSSQRVIDKLGFKYEGRLRRAYDAYEDFGRDCLVYSMLREEWE